MQLDTQLTQSASEAVKTATDHGALQSMWQVVSQHPAVIGLTGAVWLYMFAPPGKPIPKDASPEVRAALVAERKERGRETGIRFALSGFFSWLTGQFVIDLLDTLFPWLHASRHPIVFYFLLGSVGWYFGRGFWLWLDRRKNKDLGQQIKDVAEVVREVKS